MIPPPGGIEEAVDAYLAWLERQPLTPATRRASAQQRGRQRSHFHCPPGRGVNTAGRGCCVQRAIIEEDEAAYQYGHSSQGGQYTLYDLGTAAFLRPVE
jgi:hypothetical protein